MPTDEIHAVEGTDLELVFELRGDDLRLRVNKAGVLIFRTLLVDAAKSLTDDDLMRAKMFAPDIVHRIGDVDAAMRLAFARDAEF